MSTQLTFPPFLDADKETRAGRMLAEGDVRVTVTDSRSDEHITVRFKALLDNRPQSGERPRADDNRNWLRVPLKEASHVFIEVPRAGGEWPDKVGSFYPRTGRFFSDDNADPERVRAAMTVARWLNEGRDASDRIGRYRLQEEDYCGICGHQLTDPESIDRGIGPECFKKETNSKHQVKQKREGQVPEEEKELIGEILEAIQDLSDAGQMKVLREIEMWHSQERQSTRRS
jgi:hypothetical protein